MNSPDHSFSSKHSLFSLSSFYCLLFILLLSFRIFQTTCYICKLDSGGQPYLYLLVYSKHKAADAYNGDSYTASETTRKLTYASSKLAAFHFTQHNNRNLMTEENENRRNSPPWKDAGYCLRDSYFPQISMWTRYNNQTFKPSAGFICCFLLLHLPSLC